MGNKMAGFWGRAAGGFNQGTQVQVQTSILFQRFGASHGTVQEASASLPPQLNVSLPLSKAVFLLVGLCVPPTSALKCQLNPAMLHARDAQRRHVRPLPGLCRELTQTTVPHATQNIRPRTLLRPPAGEQRSFETYKSGRTACHLTTGMSQHMHMVPLDIPQGTWLQYLKGSEAREGYTSSRQGATICFAGTGGTVLPNAVVGPAKCTKVR